MLDGGLRRARYHSQRGRVQRVSETEGEAVRRSRCGSPLGDVVLPSAFNATIDADVLAAHEMACERFALGVTPVA